MEKQAANTNGPTPLEPYSPAIVSGGLVFCSGTFGIDPLTGEASESIVTQTEQALRNLANVLSESGSSMQHLVKTTIYYVQADDFAAINEVYARHISGSPPARSAVPCLVLPDGLLFCIDAVATLN